MLQINRYLFIGIFCSLVSHKLPEDPNEVFADDGYSDCFLAVNIGEKNKNIFIVYASFIEYTHAHTKYLVYLLIVSI